MTDKHFKYWAFKLSGIIIIIFLFQLIINGFTEMFLLNESSWTQPWRFVSAVFLHGDVAHLFYNLFALVLFGSMLEKTVGSKRFLVVFFISGILANLFSVNFYDSSLGASGAIFGVIACLTVIRPGMAVWAFGMPMPLFIASLLWMGGDLLGAYAYFAGNPISNTGNLAHLSGAFVGILFGFYYRLKVKERERRSNLSITIPERDMRRWEDGYLR